MDKTIISYLICLLCWTDIYVNLGGIHKLIDNTIWIINFSTTYIDWSACKKKKKQIFFVFVYIFFVRDINTVSNQFLIS